MKKQAKPHIFGAAPVRQHAMASAVERQIAVNLCMQENLTEAEKFTHSLTERYPQDGFGWKVYGVTLSKLGRTADSLAPLQKAASLMPMDFEAFNNLGCTHQGLRNAEYAEACYRRAIELNPGFLDALGNLAELLCEHNRSDEAIAIYQQRLQHAPEDGYTRHMIAKLTGQNTERAPDKYVSTVFDLYADNFDTHLTQSLRYDAPTQLVQLLIKHTGQDRSWDALDLGCGTGLVGAAIAPQTRSLAGIDLSPKMLDKARARGLYQRLACADVLAAMQTEPASSYDVIVSADVFIYIGKIDDVIREAHRLLRAGGLIAFSIELLETAPGTEQPYRLESSGRYSQSLAYLDKLANDNGFTVVEMVPSAIRTEGDKPVNGYLVVWQR